MTCQVIWISFLWSCLLMDGSGGKKPSLNVFIHLVVLQRENSKPTNKRLGILFALGNFVSHMNITTVKLVHCVLSFKPSWLICEMLFAKWFETFINHVYWYVIALCNIIAVRKIFLNCRLSNISGYVWLVSEYPEATMLGSILLPTSEYILQQGNETRKHVIFNHKAFYFLICQHFD